MINCRRATDNQQTNYTSSYIHCIYLADTTAGIDDIIPSQQTAQLSGSKKDQKGLYLAVPTTGTLAHCVSLVLQSMYHFLLKYTQSHDIYNQKPLSYP